MRCSICGYLKRDYPHHCPPAWDVWCPDRGEYGVEDGRTIFAYSAREAAENWAEFVDRNGADYSIVGGEITTVHVSRNEIEVHIFEVSGESVPHYRARSIEQ